jgi:hypothetical protein
MTQHYATRKRSEQLLAEKCIEANQKSNEGEMYRNESKEQRKDADSKFEWLELHETPQHWNWLKIEKANTRPAKIVPRSVTDNYIVLVMRFRSAVLLATLAIAKGFHAMLILTRWEVQGL